MRDSSTFEKIWSKGDLASLESSFPEGVSVSEVVHAFAERGEKLSEATFRKYVQLGLLPKSVRVRRKGRGRGSQGLYPTTVFRRVLEIRRLMSTGLTIDEIQQSFFSVTGEVEALHKQLERLETALVALRDGTEERQRDPLLTRAIDDVRKLGSELMSRLRSIEGRASMRTRMERAAV